MSTYAASPTGVTADLDSNWTDISTQHLESGYQPTQQQAGTDKPQWRLFDGGGNGIWLASAGVKELE